MGDILRFCFINIAIYCHNAVEMDFDTPTRLHFSRQIGGNFRKYLYITNPPIANTSCQVCYIDLFYSCYFPVVCRGQGILTAYPSILFTQISVFFYIITEIFAKFVRIFYHGLIVFALSMMQCRSSQQLHLQDYKSHTHAI